MLTTTILLASVGLSSSFFQPAAAPARSSVLPAATSRHVSPRLETATADSKLLTCSKCKASYLIDEMEFGTGQQVMCGVCGHEWFQTANRLQTQPPDMDLIEYPQAMKDRLAAGKPAEPVGRYRCFVGNLPYVATEEDLREIFERYGTVASVVIMVDETGRPKGFGFVNYESVVAGAKAVEELDGYELHGRTITVTEGKQRTCSRAHHPPPNTRTPPQEHRPFAASLCARLLCPC